MRRSSRRLRRPPSRSPRVLPHLPWQESDLRVLHVVPTYIPAFRYGGTIVAVHDLCRALAGNGVEVDVFTTNVDGAGESDVPLDRPTELDGVRVHYFASRTLRRIYWSPSLGRALDQQIGSYDVVHTHSIFLWPTLAAARVARLAGVPYVVSPRGMLVPELISRKSAFAKRLWISAFEKNNLERAAAIHFTSRIEQEDAERTGLPMAPSFVLANGVDLPAGPLPAVEWTSPYLLMLGRIHSKKRIDLAIRALPLIPGVRLVVAGPDEEGLVPELGRLAASLGVGERVTFRGEVSRADTPPLYSAALALVLPSISENFGNVVAEALAARCPAIVTSRVGAAEIVRAADAGFVVDDTAQGIAAAACSLLFDPKGRIAAGERARTWVEQQLSWPAIAMSMQRAYARAMATRRPTP